MGLGRRETDSSGSIAFQNPHSPFQQVLADKALTCADKAGLPVNLIRSISSNVLQFLTVVNCRPLERPNVLKLPEDLRQRPIPR